MLTRKDAEALAREVRALPYVAGSWHSGRALDRFAVTDPVTERTLTMVAEAGADVVDAAAPGSAATDVNSAGPASRRTPKRRPARSSSERHQA